MFIPVIEYQVNLFMKMQEDQRDQVIQTEEVQVWDFNSVSLVLLGECSY